MSNEKKPETAAPPGLREWPGFQLFKAGWWIQLLSEQLLVPLGIRGRHYLVLAMLGSGERLSQQQMANYMSLDPTSVVALIDELEEMGLCKRERDPDDRRRHAPVLTAAGRRMLVRAQGVIDRIDEEVFAPLSAAERAQLAELLDRIMEPYWSEKLVPARKARAGR